MIDAKAELMLCFFIALRLHNGIEPLRNRCANLLVLRLIDAFFVLPHYCFLFRTTAC